MKRSILLVCYYFPPLEGAGVALPLALHHKLGEHGIRCDVLTVKPVAYHVHEPELMDDIDVNRVYRSGSFDPQRLMYLLGYRTVKPRSIDRLRPVSSRFFPDSKIGWVGRAVSLGRTRAENRRYDAILSTSPPISAHLIAMRLADDFGLPWIADFRDFWTTWPIEMTYASHRLVKRAENLKGRIREKATLISAVNRTVADYTKADEVIANSYDDRLARLWKTPDTSGPFVIGLLGTLNSSCPMLPLFQVLDRLREDDRELFEKVRLLQVGNVDRTWIESQLNEFGMHDRVDMLGQKSRQKSVEILSAASLLYVGLADELSDSVSTGRIYTMLSSGRPILAATPHNSELGKLINEYGNGFCFNHDSLNEATAYLARLITEPNRGTLLLSPCSKSIQKYSSHEMVQSFARILDTVFA